METGIKYTIEKTVTTEMTARIMGSGTLDVFATPSMIALIEETAWKSVASELEQGMASVGTNLKIDHLAPTPVGMKVRCETELKEVDGRKLVFDVCLYGSFQRACSKLYVIAFRSNELFCLVGERNVVAHVLYSLYESLQLYVDDLLDCFEVELVEGYYLVESVQELRTELFAEALLYDASCIFLVGIFHVGREAACIEAHAASEFLQLSCSGVTCHYYYGVAEVYQSAVTVGKSSFVEHLQQHVVYIAVGFLYLVEQNDRVGVAAHFLCQLSSLFISHVSWRRTNKT